MPAARAPSTLCDPNESFRPIAIPRKPRSAALYGNGCVVHEHRQAVAMTQQGVQGRAFALGEFVPLFLRFREERLDRSCEPPLCVAAPGIEPIQRCDATEPLSGKRCEVRIAVPEVDEVAPGVGPVMLNST